MDIVQSYFDGVKQLRRYFNIPDNVYEYAIEDTRKYFWFILWEDSPAAELHMGEREDFPGTKGEIIEYGNTVVPNIVIPVFREEKYTLILISQNGESYYRVLDNTMELKG